MQKPAILRLTEASDPLKVAEIFETELSTASDEGQGTKKVDFYLLEEQMDHHEVAVLGPHASQYLLKHYASHFGIAPERVQLIGQLAQLEEFNVLHLNFNEYHPDESKLAFIAMTELTKLIPTEKLLINELSRTVTDTNIYQLCFMLE